GPSLDVGAELRVRRGFSCARETRGSACGSCYVAGRYASRLDSTLRGAGSILKPPGEVKPALPPSVTARFPTRSGVHFRSFSSCNVNSPSATNARFPRLWIGTWPGRGWAPEVPVDNFWKGCLLSVYYLSQ